MSRVGTSVRFALAAGLAMLLAVALGGAAPATAQDSYQRISGEGSSWSANFIDAMRVNVAQFGMTIDYNPSGSTSGRKNYLNGTVDFAASDIPFQFHPEDGSAPENPAPGSYVYIPVTAGGTAFMYNLKINGRQVTNLRLSGENVAKIFTGVITMWNDPAIQADNPGIVMPARQIVPVVRSDGSGSSAQFTMWMINRHPQIWTAYCDRVGRQDACGFTSFYPTISGMIAQQGDLGVAGYVSQGFAEGAIGYVNYSYALGVQFPVAKVLNTAGYYTEPTPENVAVSLLQADINRDESNPAVYLTQKLEGVYTNPDPRNYELSSYSYFILPTRVGGQFNEAKGYTLSEFARYAMCQGQQQSASLGYSPMPINLVQASFEQIARIPGALPENINIQSCNNPTFSPSGENLLAANAAMPQACDQAGQLQCPDGTGGMSNVPTAVVVPQQPGAGGQQPGSGGQQPGTGGQQPGTGGQDPGTVGQQPGTGGQQPGTGGEPGSGGEQPGTGGQQPGTGGQQPGTGGQQPGAGGQQPGTGTTGGTTATTALCATTATTTVPQAPTGTGAATTTTTTSSTTTTSTSVPGESTTTTLPPCSPPTTLAPGVVGVPGASTPVLQEGCDPDSGACGGAVVPLGGAAVTGAAQPLVGAVTPVTLEQRSRWGSAQTMIVLVSLLTLAAILGPAAAWRYFGQRKAFPA